VFARCSHGTDNDGVSEPFGHAVTNYVIKHAQGNGRSPTAENRRSHRSLFAAHGSDRGAGRSRRHGVSVTLYSTHKQALVALAEPAYAPADTLRDGAQMLSAFPRPRSTERRRRPSAPHRSTGTCSSARPRFPVARSLDACTCVVTSPFTLGCRGCASEQELRAAGRHPHGVFVGGDAAGPIRQRDPFDIVRRGVDSVQRRRLRGSSPTRSHDPRQDSRRSRRAFAWAAGWF